jgi:hypothetical protein
MTSPDILDQSIYSTQSYNRYSYALNNPMRYTDPSGYYWRKVTYFTEARIVGYAKIAGWDYLFPIDGFIDHSIWINYSSGVGIEYSNEFSSGGHIGGGGPGDGAHGGGGGNNSGDILPEVPTGVSGVVGGVTSEVGLATGETISQMGNLAPKWVGKLGAGANIIGGVLGTYDNASQAINDYNAGNTYQTWINGGQALIYGAGTVLLFIAPPVGAGLILGATISDWAQGFYEVTSENYNY